MRWPKALLALCTGAAMMAGTAAQAQTDDAFDADPTAQIAFRVVQSDLDFDEGEDIDSSGIGVRAEAGLDFDLGKTTGARIEVQGGYFDYSDETREDRTIYGAAIQVEQKISETVSVRLRARRIENVAVLEALPGADQTSIGVRVQWDKGNDRVRLYADYREREYDYTTTRHGNGWRLAAQYNRRLGSYHWLRFDVRHEWMDSEDSPRRSFQRTVARVKYSLPIAKRLRVRPSLEYRNWSYDERIARGDPNGDLRKDSYIAPGLEIAYGRSSGGIFATASSQYRIKSSNDERYQNDAFQVGLTVGYRF